MPKTPVTDSSRPTSGFPVLLQAIPNWIWWGTKPGPTGKPSKKPEQSTKAPGMTFAAALKTCSSTAGMGFMLTGGVKLPDGSTLIILDVDACRDPKTGVLSPWAQEILTHYKSTCHEPSPSGFGLHVLVAVRRPPKLLSINSKIWVRNAVAPAECKKRPELQVFGLGSAQYVTMAGNCVGEIRVVDDLDWLVERFKMKATHDERVAKDLAEFEPTLGGEDRIEKRLRGDGLGGLIDGQWFEHTGDDDSASSAYHELVKLAIRAADGNLSDVLAFMLHRTAWGRGDIDESSDPSKYARPEWVSRDIMRAVAKSPHSDPTSFFEPLPDDPSALKGPTTATPWRRFDLDEMLRTSLSPWLIRDYFREGQLGFLVAFTAVGKSTLACSWAMSVLYGRPVHGKKVRAGSVVCLVGEGRRGFANRLGALRRHYKLGPVPGGRYVEIVDFRLPLSSVEGQKAARRLIEQIKKDRGHAPSLVVIDTLSSHWAETEDSAEFGAPFVRAFSEVATDFNCVVLVLHHTTKGKGKFVMPDLQDMRGTGVFSFNPDFVFGMCAVAGGAHLEGLKCKDDEAAPCVRLTMQSTILGQDEDGVDVSAALFLDNATPVGRETDAEPMPRLWEVLEVVIRKGSCPRRWIEQTIDMTPKEVRARLDMLIEMGKVERAGHGPDTHYRVSFPEGTIGNDQGTIGGKSIVPSCPTPRRGTKGTIPGTKKGTDDIEDLFE